MNPQSRREVRWAIALLILPLVGAGAPTPARPLLTVGGEVEHPLSPTALTLRHAPLVSTIVY